MRVAVVGSGISGLLAAHLLSVRHDVTVFEADDRIGGHTNTIDVVGADGRSRAVDTGFIVYNERNYPRFTALLQRLGVASQPTTMSFSVRCERSGLEYSSEALFAQRRNALRPSHWRMLLEIVRFHRLAPRLLAAGDDSLELGRFLRERRFSDGFIDRFVVPMGAAIWSTDPAAMMRFPAAYFVRFFQNHGLLSVSGQPRWRVIRGGSKQYLEPLVRPFRDAIRTAAPVAAVHRAAAGVDVEVAGSGRERFDHVVFACHADQALRLLAAPRPEEIGILGALRYQRNEAVLHTDDRLLPRRDRARAAWNYHLMAEPGPVCVTYDMNRLQGLDVPETYCVTLNRTDHIRPERILRRLVYEHPLYTPDAVAAQQRHAEISGAAHRTSYCGAYWGYGFHEDGVNSAVRVAAELGVVADWMPAAAAAETRQAEPAPAAA